MTSVIFCNSHCLRDRAIDCPETAIKGIVKGVKLAFLEHNSKLNLKLDLLLDADSPYAIRSGLNTYFSQGLLRGLELVEDLSQPLIVVPKTGEGNVVFCQIYFQDNLVRWDNSGTWNRLDSLRQLAARLECDLFPNVERDFLMSQSDLLLNQLNWSSEQGKQFLVEKYRLTSRQFLSDWQLADFVLTLWGLAQD
ncbi:MAG: hypothetical protein ACRDEA_14375 [Microcystaceae cyanobacterium]